MFQYTIHPDSEIPVYRQLADQINAEIRSGALKTGVLVMIAAVLIAQAVSAVVAR